MPMDPILMLPRPVSTRQGSLLVGGGKSIVLNGTDESMVVDPPTGPGSDLFETGPELVLNGGFETATGTADDGTGDTFTSWTANSTGTSRQEITADAHGGTKGLLLVRPAGSGGNASVKQLFTVVPGDIIRLTFWTKGDGTNAGRYFVRDESNVANIIATTSTGVTASTTWTMVGATFTVPAGCTSVGLYLFAGAVDNTSAKFDDVSCRKLYDLTFMMWIKRTLSDINVERQYPWCRMEGDTNRKWYFKFIGTGESDDANIGKLVWGLSVNGGSSQSYAVRSGSVLTPGEWYLATATWVASTGLMTMYLNAAQGEAAVTARYMYPQADAPMRIGATDVSGNEHWFEGEIGECQVVRGKVLTATEISECLRSGIPAQWSGGTVIAHYDWRGTSDSSVALDLSALSNDLTLSNVSQAANQSSDETGVYRSRVLEIATTGSLLSREAITNLRA